MSRRPDSRAVIGIPARTWRVTYHDPKLGRDISEVVPAHSEVDAAWYVASGLGEHGMANCPLVSIEENFGDHAHHGPIDSQGRPGPCSVCELPLAGRSANST